MRPGRVILSGLIVVGSAEVEFLLREVGRSRGWTGRRHAGPRRRGIALECV